MSVTTGGQQPAPRWALGQVPEMDDAQFRQWAALLERRTGMLLSPERRSFLQTGVATRMRELDYSDYQAYFDLVADRRRGALEWITLVDRLTIHETRFFRNPGAYDVVTDYLGNRRDRFSSSRPCDAWSVGCSSGEEPYSLAMVLQEQFGEATGAAFTVTGTDISLPVLAQARQGIYTARKVEQVDAPRRATFFTDMGEACYQVVPELRRRVCFAQVNVLELDRAPIQGMQIIFCHNLLIYFRRWLRREILNQLTARLNRGGLLVIGAGDATGWQHDELEALPERSVQAYVKAGGED